MELTFPPSLPTDTHGLLKSYQNYSIYHSAAWHDHLTEACGWPVSYVVAGDVASPEVVLPLINKRVLLGRQQISLPLTHAIAPAARPGADLNRFWQAFSNGNTTLRLHSCAEGHPVASTQWRTVLDLSGFSAEEEVFRAFSKSSIQRKIRKAEKSGYSIDNTNALASYVDFEHMQALTRQRQGSPTFPKGFFSSLRRNLGEQVSLHGIRTEEEMVAAIIFFDCPVSRSSIYAYGASVESREHWQQGVNQLAMWNAIRNAYVNGQKQVDFGSTPEHLEELKQYKEKWGATSEPLLYSAINGSAGKSQAIDRDSKLVHVAESVLRKMPHSMYRTLSPMLLKVAAN